MPKPLANWKNRSEYPDPKNASGVEWAWEFLRRNQDYQKDYDLYKNFPSRNKRLSNTDYYECDPPAKPGESIISYRSRMEWASCNYSTQPIEQVIAKKYSLATPNAIVDPEDPDPFENFDEDTPFFQTQVGIKVISGKYRREYSWKRGHIGEV
jgi:hypothetical protein